MNKKVAIFIFVLTFFILPKAQALSSIDILSGYLTARLEEKDDYQVLPLMVGFNFSAEPVVEAIGLKIPGHFDFIAEPFINTVISPSKNIEAGSNFLLKYTYPLTEKIHPYLKGGVGALYMSQKTKEQSTQYNFLPQAGGGIQYFINQNTALSFEYRYRHLSNASTGSPNSGIDADVFLCGISFFFQ